MVVVASGGVGVRVDDDPRHLLAPRPHRVGALKTRKSRSRSGIIAWLRFEGYDPSPSAWPADGAGRRTRQRTLAYEPGASNDEQAGCAAAGQVHSHRECSCATS
jgi:hypothetical protein